MHTTQNGATTDPAATNSLVKVQDYHSKSQGVAQSRLDALLRRSERFVKGASLTPDPVTQDYRDAARDAELAVFEHLFGRPSYVRNESVLDESVSFADEGALEALVRDAMGAYYVPQHKRGPLESASVAVLSGWPPRH